MAITHEEILNLIKNNVGEVLDVKQDNYGVLTAEVPIHQLYKLINFLFKDMTFKFNNLVDLCGVHYPDRKGQELGVVYHIQSMSQRTIIRLKTFVSIEKPDVPSITGIYAAANWMERETYDFYGIQFLGHPNLKRILNMDEMVDFPMRKEFPLEDPFRKDKSDFHFGR